jgi:Transglycosylase
MAVMRLNILRISKWTFGTIVGAFAVIVASLAYPFIGDGMSFESHRSEITNLIETADPRDRMLPQPVSDLLLFSLARDTAPYSARLLIREFRAWPSNKGASSWTVLYATWSWLVALHFSQQDQLTLIARFAPTGDGRFGFSRTADVLYNRPLSALSPAEAGTLIILTREPSLYNNPERLSAERGRLLSRYEIEQRARGNLELQTETRR